MLTTTSTCVSCAGTVLGQLQDTGIPGFANVTYQTPVPSTPTATFGADSIINVPANLRAGTNFYNIPRFITFFDLATRTYGQLDYSVFACFLGHHDLKVGCGGQKTVNKVDESYPGGGMSYLLGYRVHQPSFEPIKRGTYGYYAVNDFRTQGTTGATFDILTFRINGGSSV